ncbi:MAG: histidine kinase [Cytophagales bacterium]|nr:MAG: histidine kinase [Cytophagales bacterium]
MYSVRFFLVLCFLMPGLLYAQIDWGAYSQSYADNVLKKPQTVGLILTIRKANNSFWTVKENSVHFNLVDSNGLFRANRRLTEIVARTTFDTARAHFFLHGVNRENADSYQFRVLQYPGWKELVPWRVISQFTDSTLNKQAAMPQMAYLGGYKAPLGSMIIMDVRRKGQEQIMGTSMVAWEKIQPAVSSIYTSDDLDVFLQKLQYEWARTRSIPFYTTKDLQLPTTNTQLVYTLNAEIYTKDQVQYQLIRDGGVVRPWGNNEYDNSFIWLNNLTPGQYQLQIRYTAQPQHVTECTFAIAPAWYQTKWAIGGMIIGLDGLLLFGYLFVRQRRRTRQEMANKQKAQLELRALYAQLNPHFVFNALSSIQGLINRQDLNGANEYLSDFARLMRESLTNSGNEETPLRRELQTMDTYLRLEQLRFGFAYNVQVDKGLDLFSTNTPSLLWQPLLENAVKHGVSTLQEAGRIEVNLEKEGNSLIVSIIDNGKGYEATDSTTGFGLKLTRERIALLNKLNAQQPILLAFSHRVPLGTTATLTFTDWLA